MPCLIFTGHPCAGKTTLANLFRERALKHKSPSSSSSSADGKATTTIDRVVIINEESACPDHRGSKRACYSDSLAEKKTRSALKSAFDRSIVKEASGDSSKTLVLLDSMNYIKGFRYELHCISKAARERHGVVWVLNEVDVAKKWNEARRKGRRHQQKKKKIKEGNEEMVDDDDDDDDDSIDPSYSDELMQELILRYEPPDERNRWDKPLYRVNMNVNAETNGNGKNATHVNDEDNNNNTAASTKNNVDASTTVSTVAQQTGLAKDLLGRSVYNMHQLSDALDGATAAAGPPTRTTTTTTTTTTTQITNNNTTTNNDKDPGSSAEKEGSVNSAPGAANGNGIAVTVEPKEQQGGGSLWDIAKSTTTTTHGSAAAAAATTTTSSQEQTPSKKKSAGAGAATFNKKRSGFKRRVGGAKQPPIINNLTSTANSGSSHQLTLENLQERQQSQFHHSAPGLAVDTGGPPDTETSATNSTTARTATTATTSTGKGEEEEEVVLPSLQEQIDAILDSFLLDVQPLQEGTSTRQNVASDANVLNDVDSITSILCKSVVTAQNRAAGTGGGGKLQVMYQGEPMLLQCRRRLNVAEMRRLRRQYIQWVASCPPEDTSERGIAKSFLSYMETQR